MDPAWAVGALGCWALFLGTRGLGNVTCILGLGRGSLLGLVAPFLLFVKSPCRWRERGYLGGF